MYRFYPHLLKVNKEASADCNFDIPLTRITYTQKTKKLQKTTSWLSIYISLCNLLSPFLIVTSFIIKKMSSLFGIFLFLYFLFLSSILAKNREYKWVVEYKHWCPDGVDGVVITINGQFPGPTIRAIVGDNIFVHLTNNLPTEGVVIHWHGLSQVKLILFT